MPFSAQISHIREIWAEKDPAGIETYHIYELHRAIVKHWRQASYLVQVMVVLMKYALLIGFLKKEHGNLAKGIPLFKQQSEGWEPWLDDVQEEFERKASSRARLVFELCVGTGQRIGDVIKMRWDHFQDGAYDFTQGKGEKRLWIPLTDRLTDCLASIDKKGLTVITDKQRGPVSYRTVAAEMRTVKAKMEHSDAATYVTHGLRKNAVIELYQSGCADEVVKAVAGHSGVEIPKKYGGRIRQRELATRAQDARNRFEQNKKKT